jgi:DNA topoisomerase IB
VSTVEVQVSGDGLCRSEPGGDCIRRRRCGRGYRYFDVDGSPLKDPAELARIKQLVIPPAWEDVWICPQPNGHIQALGTDAAGRRQYLYHDLWREQRDSEKHDRVLKFGAALPKIREAVGRHLAGDRLSRDRVLAAAVRLIDLGFFRAGGEEYLAQNGTYGLATIRREHVHVKKDQLVFEYVAKGAKERQQDVADEMVCRVVRGLKRCRSGGGELLGYRSGRRWHDVSAADINDYLREISHGDFSAKDFRTWHATVLAAVGLAVSESATDGTRTEASAEVARKRAVSRVVGEVAAYLGNTPAVARASYIDPRIVEQYERGVTIAPILTELGEDTEFGELATQGRAEEAVRLLLTRLA